MSPHDPGKGKGPGGDNSEALKKATVPDQIVAHKANLEPLFRAGYELIPLNHPDTQDRKGRNVGKAPAKAKWRTLPALTLDEAVGHLAVGGNVGVRLRDTDLVVDVDPRHFAEGDEPLARMLKDFGLPECPTVLTGGGGFHLYLRKPAGVSVRGSLEKYPGIEFKSLGRQVVAVCSIHPETRKAYVSDPMALVALPDAPEAPPGFIGALGVQSIASRTEAGLVSPEELELLLSALDPSAFPDNESWQPILFACHHATAGAGRDEFIAWSLSVPSTGNEWEIGNRWDSLHADSKGKRVTTRTLLDAIGEVDGAAGELRRAIYAQLDFTGEDYPVPEVPEADNWDWREALGFPKLVTLVEDTEAEWDADGNLLGFGPIRTMRGMRNMPMAEYLVEGMIRKRGVNSIVGPSGSWKTYLATTLALFAANGRAIPGWDLSTMECLVVYITPETPEDFPGKIAAILKAHPGLSDEHFLMVPGVIKMEKAPEIAELIALLKMVVEVTRSNRHVFLVVDTFHATWSSEGDSNRGDDVQRFINNLKTVNMEADCTSLFVHHTGKDVSKGALGSIAFYNGVDTQLLIHPRHAKITGKWDLEVETAKLKGAKKQPRGYYKAKMLDVEVSRDLNPNGTELVLTPLPIPQPGVRPVEDDEFPTDGMDDASTEVADPTDVELSLDGMIAAEAEAAKPGDDVSEMLDRIMECFPAAKKRTVDRNLVKAIKARSLEVSKAIGFPARRSVVAWEG